MLEEDSPAEPVVTGTGVAVLGERLGQAVWGIAVGSPGRGLGGPPSGARTACHPPLPCREGI
jgi:hypothetical protein